MDSESAASSSKPAPSGGRRLPSRTPSGLLGKPGALQLNQSTTPQAHALPVKRRGSFQQLKKAVAHAGRDGASSHLDSDESTPSIFAVVKKSTHWEKYGTVLVLFVADELSNDRQAVLQMLSAEGYDDNTTDSAAAALKLFSEKEVFPDIVVIDSDNDLVDTRKLILDLQTVNPTVAILVLGSPGGPLSGVAALQAGAADYMAKPLALDEFVARVERRVERQHVIKLEMEKALEDAKAMLAKLQAASRLGDVMLRKDSAAPGGGAAQSPGALNSVAETDFEEQMSELSEENVRLGQRVLEMERKLEAKEEENRVLEAKLSAIDARVAEQAAAVAATGRGGDGGAGGGGGGLDPHCQVDGVVRPSMDLKQKVDELERLVLLQQQQQQQECSQEGALGQSKFGRSSSGGGDGGSGCGGACGGGCAAGVAASAEPGAAAPVEAAAAAAACTQAEGPGQGEGQEEACGATRAGSMPNGRERGRCDDPGPAAAAAEGEGQGRGQAGGGEGESEGAEEPLTPARG